MVPYLDSTDILKLSLGALAVLVLSVVIVLRLTPRMLLDSRVAYASKKT